MAVAFIGWSFVGFEAASSISEEVHGPQTAVPKAMIVSMVAVAAVVLFSGFAIILAAPDLAQIGIGAASDDPVATILSAHFGVGVTRPLFALFGITFFAALVAVQASASRLVFALARDRALPAAAALSRESKQHKLPVVAVNAVAACGLFVLLCSVVGDVYSFLIGLTIGGFFITFTIVLTSKVVSHIRYGWPRARFSLGILSLPTAIAAACWSAFQTVNVSWPRMNSAPWYMNYSVPLMLTALTLAGVVVYHSRRSYIPTVSDHV
ncbi:MAG: APC family permease [Rhodococcus sp. (in: high G+C Gram-positive bacteria)]